MNAGDEKYKILFGIRGGITPLGRRIGGWEDNIKLDLKII
jgi:hypothetical protein